MPGATHLCAHDAALRQFIQQAREMEEVHRRYLGVEIRLTGTPGLSAPQTPAPASPRIPRPRTEAFRSTLSRVRCEVRQVKVVARIIRASCFMEGGKVRPTSH